MNLRVHILQFFSAAFMMAAWSLPAAPAAAPAAPEISKSVFVYPGDPKEGRDPFFPNSMRPYESSPERTANAPSLTDLVVKSILRAGTRTFAIINNHTFAPGEDGTVLTSDGRRLTIHCVAIDPSTQTVIVESSGARAALRFSSDQ